MNVVDVLIILILISTVIRGSDMGFIHQALSTAGFFGGLLLGAAIEPKVIGYAHSPLGRLGLTLLATLGTAMLFLFICEMIGVLIKRKVQLAKITNRIDNALGAVLAGVSVLALVWLSAPTVVSLPYPEIQTTVRASKIVAFLDRNLPPAPNIIADLGHLIAPNGFPNVFNGLEPAPTLTTLPTPAALAAAVQKDQASVVKIEGQGCGGIVTGSGFVVSSNLVTTNAHVVAGISSPYVIDAHGTHHATAIWFDPNLDLAVLRVSGLAGGPLSFNTQIIAHGTPAGVLGYPGGGPFQADTAAVLDEFTAVGRNIYNQGDTTRDVYSVQADVIPGNSGGPLVDLDGNVIGVVFATSTEYNSVGYALSIHQVINEINQAKATNQAVSTGSCAE